MSRPPYINVPKPPIPSRLEAQMEDIQQRQLSYLFQTAGSEHSVRYKKRLRHALV